MKRLTILLSVITASLLFTGCGNDSTKDASDATAKAVESSKEAAAKAADAAKEATNKAIEATKEAASKAADAAKEAANATKEAASDAVESVKESAVQAADAAANAVSSNDEGKNIYAKCSACHGVDGKTKALGKSAILAGQSKDDLISKINAYKAGTRNVAGMGNLMQGQVAGLDDAAVEAVATYISSLK